MNVRHPQRLRALITTLEKYRRLRDRPGELVIPDTNVLLHFQRIDLVPWKEVVPHAEKIRLVLPLVVLDELDHKRAAGGTIAKRARSAVKPLDALQDEFEARGFGELPSSGGRTTVEFLTDERGHRRLDDPDEEILDRATFLHRVTGRTVLVVTDDYGMRVRETAREEKGVRALKMPEKFRRDQYGAETD